MSNVREAPTLLDPADRRPDPSAGRLGLDVVGAALLAAAVIWSLLAAWLSGGDARRTVGTLIAAGGAFALARLVGPVSRLLLPALVLGGTLVVVGGLGGGPFSYANANAALFVQASLAATIVAVATGRRWLRIAGAAAAVGFAALVVVGGSVAGTVLVLLLPAAALIVFVVGGARSAVAICAGLFLVALSATLVLSAVRSPARSTGFWGQAASMTLTERRLDLWHDALRIMMERPVTGVGPSRFQEASPTARGDPDARWAHHEFLQQGAELGLPGLILLVLLFLWGFARLLAVAPADAVTALGAAALAALAIHASVDYVMHFPAVPAVTALLVGGAASPVEGGR